MGQACICVLWCGCLLYIYYMITSYIINSFQKPSVSLFLSLKKNTIFQQNLLKRRFCFTKCYIFPLKYFCIVRSVRSLLSMCAAVWSFRSFPAPACPCGLALLCDLCFRLCVCGFCLCVFSFSRLVCTDLQRVCRNSRCVCSSAHCVRSLQWL